MDAPFAVAPITALLMTESPVNPFIKNVLSFMIFNVLGDWKSLASSYAAKVILYKHMK